MKPMGTIPADYGAIGGELAIAGFRASDLVARAGDTPLFVYDCAIMANRVARLRAAFPAEVSIHYAMKANPHPEIVSTFAAIADGIDVASAGEMAVALRSGMAADGISFAGPGKRDGELRAAISAGVTLNIESAAEGWRAIRIGAELGLRPRIAVRVNPDFEIKGSGMRMGGGAKPFGVDEADAAALCRDMIAADVEWRGFHIFAGSQALDAAAIIEAQAATVALAGRLAEDVGAVPPLVNLGGGLGIPYFPGENPLDIEQIGTALAEALASRAASLAVSAFAVELGRWLVGEAGVYLTRIVDRKISHGQIFLVTDGGLHHQLAASGNFGTVVRRNYPVAIANRFDMEADEEASIVGCLCTPLDRLADRVMLPRADVGDLVAIFMAGAYGATASPAGFLGHPPAAEIVLGELPDP